MICTECEFNRFCYAADPQITECDERVKGFKDEYYFYNREINVLKKRKKTASLFEISGINAKIDQYQEFMEYCCQDMCRPPRPETDDLPF